MKELLNTFKLTNKSGEMYKYHNIDQKNSESETTFYNCG